MNELETDHEFATIEIYEVLVQGFLIELTENTLEILCNEGLIQFRKDS
jgi:hypothetical protein